MSNGIKAMLDEIAEIKKINSLNVNGSGLIEDNNTDVSNGISKPLRDLASIKKSINESMRMFEEIRYKNKKMAVKWRLKNRKQINSGDEFTDDRDLVINIIAGGLINNEITWGEALKKLRVNALDLDQTEFSRLVGVSRKTISDIENDKGNYTVAVLDCVFKPFGLHVAIIPTSIDRVRGVL